jgi:hypothetical protein
VTETAGWDLVNICKKNSPTLTYHSTCYLFYTCLAFSMLSEALPFNKLDLCCKKLSNVGTQQYIMRLHALSHFFKARLKKLQNLTHKITKYIISIYSINKPRRYSRAPVKKCSLVLILKRPLRQVRIRIEYCTYTQYIELKWSRWICRFVHY